MADSDLTLTEARRLLSYDPATGLLKWLIRRRGIKPSKPAGCIRPDGYVTIRINGVLYLAHRLAWLIHHGEWPSKVLDHRDTNPSNNRLANLRDVGRDVNGQNRRKSRKGSASGLIGVSVCGARWESQISVNGESVRLGYFDTPEQAHTVYVEAKRRLHPGNTL